MDASLRYGAPNIQANIEFDAFNGGPISSETASALSLLLREENDVVTQAAFNRFELLIRRMSTLPGQRIIIFISPGFLSAGEEAKTAALIDRAIHATFAINTMDANALVKASISDLYREHRAMMDARTRAALADIATAAQPQSGKVRSELADGTGGVFFHDGDNHAAAFHDILAPPDSYYVLAYRPQNLAADGSYRSLNVTIPGSSYTVDAGRGFFAPARPVASAEVAKAALSENLFSTQEQHELPVTFESQVTQTAPDAKKIIARADVDISHLALRRANGVWQENLSAAAVLFDREGRYLNRADQFDQTELHKADLENLGEDGYYMRFSFDAKPGGYILHIVAQNLLVDGRISAGNLPVTVPKGAVPSLTPKQIAERRTRRPRGLLKRSESATKNLLGENFQQEYPASRYLIDIQTELVALRYDTNDLQKLYPAATQAIAKDPDNLFLLTLAGWAILRAYDDKNPQFFYTLP
jgi:hypothetical protein